jgi:DNA modification methylase
MCGDAGDRRSVGRLLDGQEIDGIVTDPPYELDGYFIRDIINGFDVDRAVVLTGQYQAYGLIGGSWKFAFELVWVHRTSRSIPSKFTPNMHHANFVMITRGAARLGWQRPYPDFSSVIQLDGAEYDNRFSYGKMPELFERVLLGFKHKVWADPFFGYGATLAACENLGKTIYAMEISSEVVALALERFAEEGYDVELVNS